jgi:cell wall-associated NlpC family hydrolase
MRRLAIGVAAAATTVGATMAVPTGSSSASFVWTSSETIGADANHALWMLVRWQASRNPADYAAFIAARHQVLEATAAETGVDSLMLEGAWWSTDEQKQQVVLAAMSQLGVPYRSRMSQANRGFDCSGLVLYAYAQAGIALPRSSRDQIRAAEEIADFDLKPGDLVYYPGHISMYLGEGLVVHSPQSGRDVEVRQMFDRSLRFGDAITTDPAG